MLLLSPWSWSHRLLHLTMLHLNVRLHSLRSRRHMHLLESLRRLWLLLMHLHGHGLLHWKGLHLHWLHLQWLHQHWLHLHWLKLLLHQLRRLEPLLPWLQPLLSWMQPWLHGWLRRTHGNRLVLCLYDLCLGLKICRTEFHPLSEWQTRICSLPDRSHELPMLVCTKATIPPFIHD